MKIKSGVKLVEERVGTGAIAERGDHLIYNLRGFLSQGDEIALNRLSAADREEIRKHHPEMIDERDGVELINFRCRLGRREVVAGVEYALYGMREGGYRKVRVSPHLAYREEGVTDLAPGNAVIVFEIWLRKIAFNAERRTPGCRGALIRPGPLSPPVMDLRSQ